MAVSAEHSENIIKKLPGAYQLIECVHVYVCTEKAKKLHYGKSIGEIGVEEECVMEWDCVVCNSIFSWLVLAVILLHRMFVEIIQYSCKEVIQGSVS